MRKPRNGEQTRLNFKSSRNRARRLDSVKKTATKAFSDITFPIFFSFWCCVALFHARFGFTRGNEENRCESLPNGMVMEQDVSVIDEDFSIQHVHPNVEDLISGTNELEELLSIVLGYDPYTCHVEEHEDARKSEPEVHNGRMQLTYPNLDEFKYISSKGKSGSPRQLVNITHRLEADGTPYNYASALKGAKVVGHNKEAKGASNVLDKDHDKYLRNPCSVGGKFFIIELADETLVDAVKIANFEHHSSNFKDFELYGSQVYPTETWERLGSFVAANSKHVQCFKLPEPKWVRYLKVNLLSHYGSDFYCTLSVVEVFGVDAIEQMLEDLIVPSGESSTNGPSNPNSTALPSTPESSSNSSEVGDVAHTVVEPVNKGAGSVDEGKTLTSDIPKKPVSTSSVADPILKARQLPNNRLHADAALKVLLQKVRSLEVNLSVLEEYIKELNRRRVDYLPELDKELNKFSTLLEKTKLEMKNLLEWKETMEKGVLELESWRTVVSTQMDILVSQNSMLRLEVEKVVHDQVSLESKGVAVFSDFTLEQDHVTPPNGWKAYYAATRAIVTVNDEFFRIIRERLLQVMHQFWLNADYVKCFHATGELFSGYNAVMESWQLAFNWGNVVDFQVRDVRARVMSSMAWVTMKGYLDIGGEPFHVTNVYELHNGRWYMVHHHCSSLLIHGQHVLLHG